MKTVTSPAWHLLGDTATRHHGTPVLLRLVLSVFGVGAIIAIGVVDKRERIAPRLRRRPTAPPAPAREGAVP